MEQDGRDAPAAPSGVSRNSNVVYVMPHDWASISQFLAPILQRVDDATLELQALVITSDAELAAAVTAAAVKVADGRDVSILAATSARRAARLLKTRPAQIVAAAPDALLELLSTAAIKLDTVRAVCIAWADELVARDALAALETIMAEVPKDAARTIVAADVVPAVDELIERYARRARRVASPASAEGDAINLDYVMVAPSARLEMLRRILDDVDPRSALVFARESEEQVRALLVSLGYRATDGIVTVGPAAPPGTDLVVLFDLPTSRGELREASGAAARAIALVRPRQLSSLRALTGGGTLRSVTISEASARARDRDARIRAELRAILVRGDFGRDLLALEPLLEEFDGVEIAASAVHLLEAARATPAPVAPAAAAAPRERTSAPVVRLFVNVGARDGVRAADLLGAIANEGGIPSSDVGRIDIRESHSIVEVAATGADAAIDRVTGTSIRGRRAV
ncbi:MAG: DbpA RNA binding domain-containing protein, partial [Gemmatimonadaceae bacterium]